jgi:hypothetical protein
MEEKKGLGLFTLVLGIIFLIIAIMTFWAVGLNWNPTILIFAPPLLVFSISTITFSIFLMFTAHLNQRLKGLILIIDGLIPIISSVYALNDSRLQSISDVRVLVTVPVFLAGIFLLIYGAFLLVGEKLIIGQLKKKLNKILGLISVIIGDLNTSFFIMVLSINPELMNQNSISLLTWFVVGGILIIFGFDLIIKKVK